MGMFGVCGLCAGVPGCAWVCTGACRCALVCVGVCKGVRRVHSAGRCVPVGTGVCGSEWMSTSVCMG